MSCHGHSEVHPELSSSSVICLSFSFDRMVQCLTFLNRTTLQLVRWPIPPLVFLAAVVDRATPSAETTFPNLHSTSSQFTSRACFHGRCSTCSCIVIHHSVDIRISQRMSQIQNFQILRLSQNKSHHHLCQWIL